MNKVLESLFAEVEALDLADTLPDVFVPAPVLEGEEIIGKIEDDFTKKLVVSFLIIKKNQDEVLQEKKDAQLKELNQIDENAMSFASLGEILDKLKEDLKPDHATESKAVLLEDLFWFSVRASMPKDKDLSRIRIAEDWQVVALRPKEEDCNCPSCTLRRQLEGSLGEGAGDSIGELLKALAERPGVKVSVTKREY